MVPNAPKWKETHENLSLGSNCVDRVRRFRGILTRLCGTNSCINCTRLAHLHRVPCNSETIPNAPKRKETHQKMSLGSNGVDRERSSRKILARHRAGTYALIAPVWCFCTKFRAERNGPKHEFRVQWCGSGAFVVKISKTSWHELLH